MLKLHMEEYWNPSWKIPWEKIMIVLQSASVGKTHILSLKHSPEWIPNSNLYANGFTLQKLNYSVLYVCHSVHDSPPPWKQQQQQSSTISTLITSLACFSNGCCNHRPPLKGPECSESTNNAYRFNAFLFPSSLQELRSYRTLEF